MNSDLDPMATTAPVPPNGADRPLSKLERRRLEIEAKREANKAKAEAFAEARELALLDDEDAYEDARAKAYEDPSIGPDRCLGGLLEGAGASGHVLFKWPSEIEWRRFQDRGIMKKDGLTTELADDLTSRCLLYPNQEKWKEIRQRNPSASFQVAVKITEALSPPEAEAGKGLRSSVRRR